MSGSETVARPLPRGGQAADPATIDTDDAVQELLGALGDPDGRAILRATGEEALSASELSTACGLPLSTTYRKLEVLTDAGLLGERTRISRTGKHASEYVRRVDDVVVSLGDDGDVELRLSGDATPRAATPARN